MPQAILPRPLENPCFEDDNKRQLKSYHENEVDTINISTVNPDDDETEEEEEEIVDYDNAIVVNDQPHLPHFGSVSVVNSNDVHFGNKTVYKGPVTIKQFVYPKSDITSEVFSNLSEVNGINELNSIDGGNKVLHSEGVDNPSFVKGDPEIGRDKPEEREQETDSVTDRIRKSIKYVKAFPCKKPKQTLLLVFLLILSLTTISAILIWRNPTRTIQTDQNKDNEEEEKNEPIDYTADTNAAPKDKLRIVTRINWVAKPPSGPIDNLTLPVSLVVIQHTATESCNSQASCVWQAHTIQTFHMESRNWSDVGYNFMIGGDGAVYEGRSWTKQGAHTLGVNDKSIGIAFIGTYTDHVPSALMLNAFHNLVNKGVHDGYLTKNYKVMGARQFSGTESPGKAFYDIIKTWVHWSEKL